VVGVTGALTTVTRYVALKTWVFARRHRAVSHALESAPRCRTGGAQALLRGALSGWSGR